MTALRDTQVVIGPNASMSVRMAGWVLAIMATVSLGIAGGLTLLGFWPVLPFAGLELAALAAALVVSLRRNRYREVIVFAGQAIRVECGVADGGARLKVEWPRSSTRVLVEQGGHRNDPTRLLLASGTQRLELGRCLTDEDRERLAARLRELIHPGWCPAVPRSQPADFNI